MNGSPHAVDKPEPTKLRLGTEAVLCAKRGWCVFPCNPSNKKPLTEHGLNDATRDRATIEQWWREWPDAMIGVRTGPESGVFVVDLDLDPAKGLDGIAAFAALRNGHELPETIVTQTPRGGQHFWFKYVPGIKNSAGKIGPGIDVRGAGGYVIAPPSRRADGIEYQFLADDKDGPADAPQWLRDRLTAKSETKSDKGKSPGNGRADDNYARVVLERECAAVATAKPGTRNHTLNRAAFSLGQLVAGGLLKEAEVSDRLYGAAIACGLAKDDGARAAWNSIASGLGAGKKQPRGAPSKDQQHHHPGPELGTGPELTGDNNLHRLTELNGLFCVVLDGGKTRVLKFEEHVEQIGRLQHVRRIPTFLSFEDFRNFHCNRTIVHEGKIVSIGQWWLRHPARRQYDGIVFQPAGADVIAGRFNLWRGWGVEPKPGNWSLMREHIREVLANGVRENFEYIMNWLAWTVQNPDRRAEVALVFKGARGTGKGTLGNAMCHIFGQHGTHLSSAEHLTGRFNAHLRDACLLFCDESYWPGDKSAEGALKALITEPSIAVEPKHREIVMVRNMSQFMASNENWVIPAGEKERRFAVFDVAEHQAQNEKWFRSVYSELEDGGYSAMLHDLLSGNLGDWHPRRIPRTSALLDQQSESLSPLDMWWVELLKTGVLVGADPNNPHRAVSNGFDEYLSEWAADGGQRTRTVKRKGLFDQARAISPRLRGVSDHTLGRFLKGRGCDNKHRVLRRHGWTFPPLAECRKAWEARFPGWQWDDPELVMEWQNEIEMD